MLRSLIILFMCSVLFASCEKAEQPLVLPPTGTAQHGMVDMGPDYQKQIFYNLATGSVVYTSDPTSWHLAFQADADGRHVYMNGGHEVYTYNTHQRDMDQVVSLPANLKSNGAGWDYDAPSGNPDSTGIGDWFDGTGATKGDVYIVQVEPGRYMKMRVTFGDSRSYRIEWAALETTGNMNKAELVKNTDYNFVYFNFDQGAVKPEPRKDSWDIVFTRYRYVYHTVDYPNFPYQVSGVLLNPYMTKGTMDSVHTFSKLNAQLAFGMTLTTNRDIIGFDWKTYSNGRYEVNRNKSYVIQTASDQLYKLHFLDFYNSAGEKGSPSFEYERLK